MNENAYAVLDNRADARPRLRRYLLCRAGPSAQAVRHGGREVASHGDREATGRVSLRPCDEEQAVRKSDTGVDAGERLIVAADDNARDDCVVAWWSERTGGARPPAGGIAMTGGDRRAECEPSDEECSKHSWQG